MTKSGEHVSTNRRWKPPFQPWFEGDFAGSFNVRQMAPLARLMYRSLLQQAWNGDTPPFLPNDDATLRLMADAPSARSWATHRSQILARFQQTEDGKLLFHPKSLREYERAVAEHGRKSFGGLKRWTGEHKQSTEQSTNSAPPLQEQADTAPLSSHNHNHNYNHNQSISTTKPAATEVAKDNKERAGMDCGGRDGANAANSLIDEIFKAHPRLQKPVDTRDYVIVAAQEEITRGKTWKEALEYLLERTRLYREITDEWPEDQKRYVMSSHEFFRSGEYRTDQKFWKKASDGKQAESLPTAAMPEPTSARIRKQLEAEGQATQTGRGGGSA